MTYAVTTRGRLPLLGGALCLDFINTVDWRTGPNPKEFFVSYSDLIEWSQSIGTIDAVVARRLKRNAAGNESAALATITRAIKFRESLYGILIAVVGGKKASSKMEEDFNRIFADLASNSGISLAGDSFQWVWRGDPENLDLLLWPVVVSAFELLTSGDAKRVRECAGPFCGWLFVDRSKGHKRQWCSMKGCGNRAKARRHYQRTRI